MNNWKKEFKKNLDNNLVRETPKIEALEKVESKKTMPLFWKITIPVGAAAAFALAVALPWTLKANEKLSDGEVFLKAGDALARLGKAPTPNSEVRAKINLSTSEGKNELGGVSSMIYYIGLLLDNGFDVVRQPMNFAASYHITNQGLTSSIDLQMMVAADIDRANDKLVFYGRKKARTYDSSKTSPFFDQGRFVYDITYDEESDTVDSFRFNINSMVFSQIVPEYIEFDGTSYWKSTDDEASSIKDLFTGYFSTVQAREAVAVDAEGGERLYADASNHAAKLMGFDIQTETIA